MDFRAILHHTDPILCTFLHTTVLLKLKMRIGLILKQDFQIKNSKLVFTNMYCICSIAKVGTLTVILSWFKIHTCFF